jgi:hypothetical protein
MDTFKIIHISAVKTYRSRVLGALALLAAFGFVPRTIDRKKNLLITNLNHVGRAERQKESVDDKFDVIIVGWVSRPKQFVLKSPFLNI